MEQPQYGEWEIGRLIGRGSFGEVYEIEKRGAYDAEKSALKIIRIPQNVTDIEERRADGYSDEGIRDLYEDFTKKIYQEIELLRDLQGTTNVVNYLDSWRVQQENGFGWDIMIRMELLTPLKDYQRSQAITKRDVAKLGIDLCRALERCQQAKIIHRDIKPENIFISKWGDFKLGDFGIARIAEHATSGAYSTRKGTVLYMAPEVNKGNYGFGVDIYSLGLVMYRLLNNNLMPFFPQDYLQRPCADVSEMANTRRLSGESFPYPSEDQSELADIVLKACQYKPEDRFSGPEQMRNALETYLAGSEDADVIVLDMQEMQQVVENNSTGSLTGRYIQTIDLWSAPALGSAPTPDLPPIPTQAPIPTPVAAPDPEPQQILRLSRGKLKIVAAVAVMLAVVIIVAVKFWPAGGESQDGDVQTMIQQGNYSVAYQFIAEQYHDNQNVDTFVRSFVESCESAGEIKRIVAAMKLLSDDIAANADLYRETVDWLYQHEKNTEAEQILNAMKDRGGEIAELAAEIRQERSSSVE